MNRRLLWLVPALVAVVALTCCRGGHTAVHTPEGDTLQLKYASLLSIVSHEDYTVATVRNPWKQGATLHTYVLVPRTSPNAQAVIGNLPHSPYANATIIRTPLERAAVFTTVHCSLLTQLGVGDRIAAVADLKYIKIPYIQQRVQEGHIADCGNGLSPVVEKIMEVHPDAILLSPFENSGGYGKTAELGIPIIECAEYMENSPLARAEWMRFYGLLFDRGRQTDSLFAAVDSSYTALSLKAQAAGEGASVLIDKMVGSVWYVPGGRSTIGQMVQDAGGRYTWADDTHSGSLSLPFETVLERSGEAEVWLFRYSSDHSMTRQELLSEHRGYSELAAYRTRQVFGCNVERSLFYEESPFRPDYLLSDFIQLCHPGINGMPPLRYFEKTE